LQAELARRRPKVFDHGLGSWRGRVRENAEHGSIGRNRPIAAVLRTWVYRV
jgi:hypothetical protein